MHSLFVLCAWSRPVTSVLCCMFHTVCFLLKETSVTLNSGEHTLVLHVLSVCQVAAFMMPLASDKLEECTVNTYMYINIEMEKSEN